MEDLTPHEHLYEKLNEIGFPASWGGFNIIYYKRVPNMSNNEFKDLLEALEKKIITYEEYLEQIEEYKKEPRDENQADIIVPIDLEVPYVDSNGEPELLRGTAAKIMLMRELVKNFGVGGQLSLGLE